MASIPPNPIGSALQSGQAQPIQSKDRISEDNLRTDASRRLAGAGNTADIIEIEETDTADTQVHADTGGTGGQGRFDAPDTEPVAEESDKSGITMDDQGHAHVDLSA